MTSLYLYYYIGDKPRYTIVSDSCGEVIDYTILRGKYAREANPRYLASEERDRLVDESLSHGRIPIIVWGYKHPSRMATHVRNIIARCAKRGIRLEVHLRRIGA